MPRRRTPVFANPRRIDSQAVALREALTTAPALRFPGPLRDGAFQTVNLPHKDGWEAEVRLPSRDGSVVLRGTSTRLESCYIRFDGAHDEKGWLDREKLDALEAIARLVYDDPEWKKLITREDICFWVLSWLTRWGATFSGLSLTTWLTEQAQREINWRWVWLRLPIREWDLPDFEDQVHVVSPGITLRAPSGLVVRRLLHRFGPLGGSGADATESGRVRKALGIPERFWNEPDDLSPLRAMAGQQRPFDWSPKTSAEELEESLRWPTGLFVAVWRLGTVGRCYESARRIHHGLAPLMVLDSGATTTLAPNPTLAGAVGSGRSGFVINPRTRTFIPIDDYPLRLGDWTTFGPDPGENFGPTGTSRELRTRSRLRSECFDHLVPYLRPRPESDSSGLQLAAVTLTRALADSSLESRVVSLYAVVEILFSSGTDLEGEEWPRVQQRFRGCWSKLPAADRELVTRSLESLHTLRNKIVHDAAHVETSDHGAILEVQGALASLIVQLALRTSPETRFEDLKEKWLNRGAAGGRSENRTTSRR